MLKDLLRSLIESVFTSKKSYISAQAFPGKVARTVIENQDGGMFTAPADGYFGFAANGVHTVDMYVQNMRGVQDIYSRFTLALPAGSEFTGSAIIPVCKGDRLIFSLDKVPSELWFIPTEGSR